MTDRPLHVCNNPNDAAGLLRTAVRGGWRAHAGFALPTPTWDLEKQRIVCHGPVADEHALGQALLAATRGCGIIATAHTPLAEALADDLHRLEAPASAADVAPASILTVEEEALLRHLADGSTIAAAAKAEFVALRTANRRIAAARKKLGVTTTREAVIAFTNRIGDQS
ncbi:hypothetical protein [Haloglycomyces albus]|uniref:hypothetical protein n=1 Tax=Haloglycomyces albus TaxID=526067 RepID=UPI00046D3E43|nr:hypothetical protein [Haloglycomyces albus]